MGHGSYTSADWERLKVSAKITEKSNERDLFRKKSMDPRFDPKFIHMREARDSEEHPDSTPIILGLDVTGSMGYLSSKIAKEGLHETMMKLFSTKPVADPQLLFAAIGDVSDSAPLQVTQFESDIRIAEQLLDLWLEGRGGDGPEDYQLLWYFAAKHVSADCFSKRNKKGFLFTIGDADCHESAAASSFKKVFGDTVLFDQPSADLAKKAGDRFELFHIHISERDGVPSNLQKILPGRLLRIRKYDVDALPEIIVSVLLLMSGKKREDVLAEWSEATRPIVENAISGLTVGQKSGYVF